MKNELLDTLVRKNKNVLTCVCTALLFVSAAVSTVQANSAQRIIRVDGVERTCYFLTPEGLAQDAPVVIALHGSGASGKKFSENGTLARVFGDAGFSMIFPDALKSSNGRTSWRANLRVDSNDVAFIRAIIDEVSPHRKVFICGFSSGGLMAYSIAAAIPDRIAAFGVMAGSMYVPPTKPVSGIIIHGTGDTSVRYEAFTGRDGVPLPGTEACIRMWRDVNRCDELPKEVPPLEDQPESVCRTVWKNPSNKFSVESIIVTGGIHTWYSKKCCGVDAAGEMLRFFKAHAAGQ